MTGEAPTLSRRDIGWLILILMGVWTIHLTGSFWVGYISDDYDLLRRAPSVSIFRPLGDHHYSPFISWLFKLAAEHDFSPVLWHCVAVAVHTVSVVLVLALARIALRMRAWPALTVTALFALSAAGYEALAWACSIGYVLVLPPILLALLIIMDAPARRAVSTGILLAILQACAFLLWDWGILLFPLLSLAFLMWRLPRKDLRLRQASSLLWPCLVTWCLFVWLKGASGYRPGYHMPLDYLMIGAKTLAAAPLTNLLPNANEVFIKSIPGMLSAGSVWAMLCWSAVKNRVVALSVALYLVCLLPVVLFAALQARYTYIATPFLGMAIVGIVSQLRIKHLAPALCSLLILANAVWATERSQLWVGAYRAVRTLQTAINKIPDVGKDRLVVVNLPDSFGSPNMIWRPFVWRNGLSAFQRKIERVNTPYCPFISKEAPIRTMERNEIAACFPESDIYEVKYLVPEDWRQFHLVPFQHRRIDNPGEQSPGSYPREALNGLTGNAQE